MTSRTPSRQSSVEEESKPGPLTRLLFSRQSSRRRKTRSSKSQVVEFEENQSESRDSDRSCERPTSPGSGSATPTRSRSKKFTGFASRSLRKSQWRLFKHRTFFGSRASTKTKNNNNQLQLPRLTLRHPSVDGSAMPLAIDGDENEFLAIRSTQRRWTESESSGRLRDSRDSSSGYDGSHDPLDDQQAMTAPVSPCVPLSASSSQSEGWKYNSQRLLFKLKAHRLGYITGFSHTSSTSSSTDSTWKSLDSQTWRHSLDDKEVTLRGAQLETISDAERHALQLIAVQKLTKTLPGISLKKETSLIRQKRQKFTKGSRTLTAGDVTRRPSGSSSEAVLDEKRVFGVSLVDCMQNDRRLDMESRCRSLDDSAVCLSIPRSQRSSCGSKSVRSEPEIVTAVDESKRWLYPSTQNLYPGTSSHPSSPSPIAGSAPPTCSLMKETSPPAGQPSETTGRFIKKQRPSSASFSYSLDAVVDDIDPHTLRVPRIVENCTQYLMAYGLNAVGLFRVAGNTKRCRQLRLALERVGGGAAIGNDMVENTTTHDVATLLKEYFRDLPQSLLPKEHYQAYISASKIANLEERIECFRLLVALLSPPSVDTIFVLLMFLHEVAENSSDRESSVHGETTVGNKMDAKNLATIFAPCILRPDHDKTAAILQENDMQVTVLETMITHVQEIFRIPKDLQCKIFNKLRETEPMRLDRILDQIARAEGYPEHPLTSPFPATLEEDASPREKPAEKHPNGKTKVSSQRSGSWPFSLRSPKPQRFFPNDESINPSSSSTASAAEDITVVSASSASSSKKEQLVVSTPSTSARSPSRERDLRSAAAAARRRLRNVATVIRAFRFSSVTRSTPNMSNSNF